MRKRMDVLIIGFMLFANFFGAGNLIFPPFLGATSGSNWLTSFVGFIVADIGIILLSIYAIAKAGSYQNIASRAGKRFGISIELIMMLCLGPILVIPRTSATTFELSIAPIFGDFNKVIFSIIFFTLVFLLTMRPSKTVNIIGKYLTPVLLVTLFVLIVKGIISPLGDIKTDINSESLFAHGLTQGYQTMDALGMGGVVAFIIASFKSRGYSDKKEVASLTIKAFLIAGIGLIIVYGGLAFLGATMSNSYNGLMSQTELLSSITRGLLGNLGTILLGIIVACACFTTAASLTSITAKYFSDLTKNKIKYEYLVMGICIYSTIMSNLGVDRIIAIAVPILTVLYPVAIILVLLSSMPKIFTTDSMFKGAAYTTLVISTLTVIDSFGISIGFIHKLPFNNLGFNWIIPALIGAFIAKLISNITSKVIYND